LESPRTFELTGNELSVIVDNILGGREYEIQATVTNETGQKAIARIKTPYIREFENIAPLDKITVMASYYFFFPPWQFQTDREPVFGSYSYSVTDPIIIARQIDLATGHCIDGFFLSWDWHNLTPRIQNLVDHPMAKEMKFAILYDSAKRLIAEGWAVNFDKYYNENVSRLKRDFRYFSEEFFPLDQFQIVDGKPIVYFYDSCVYTGDVENAISTLRNYLKHEYNNEVYLISDHIDARQGAPTDPSWTEKISPFDGITAWGGSFYGPTGVILGKSYGEQLDELYKVWHMWATNHGKGIIPSMKPSEDTTRVPWGGLGNYELPRSPKLFKEWLKILLRYTDPNLKMIRIDTWNDWNENTEIEPSREEGLTYLNILKDVISSY
jgi:hypothetical protein